MFTAYLLEADVHLLAWGGPAGSRMTAYVHWSLQKSDSLLIKSGYLFTYCSSSKTASLLRNQIAIPAKSYLLEAALL